MVLAALMSSGRTTPATVSSRSSAFTRTSWRPWITRLPLGSTLVTTAATVRFTASERLTEPWPLDSTSLFSPTAFSGSKALGSTLPMEDSSPRKCERPRSVDDLRVATEVFCTCALSAMAMLTVRMSPMRCARWSWKKARAPLRQRLLAPAGRGIIVPGGGSGSTSVLCGSSAEG